MNTGVVGRIIKKMFSKRVVDLSLWNTFARPFLELSTDIIICLSPTYDILDWNHSAEKHYDWLKEDVVGKNYRELCRLNQCSSLLLEYIVKMTPLTPPIRGIQEKITQQNHDGFVSFVNWSGTYLFDSTGQSFGILLLGHPYTENNLAEQQIRHLKNYIDTIIDVVPGSLYYKDRGGVYLACNDVFVKKSNLKTKEEIIGKTDDDLWPDQADSIRKNDQEVIRLGGTLEVEETVTLSTGERLYFASVKTPLRNENGEIIGLVGNSLDITELKEAKEKAEIASRAKTQFLAVASHELRLPLTGIITTGSFLAEGDVPFEKVKEFGQIILDSGTYLLSNVNSILDFAKLEADKFEVIPSPIDFKAHIEETTAMLTAAFKQKGLELFIHYEADAPHNIIADPRLLRHIMANLVSNAIQYTEKGHIRISVKCLEQDAHSAQLEIAVEDTGIGIPSDKLNVIFDRFSQVEDAYIRKNSRSGTGLGLSIVRKLVNLLNGDIRVISELGKGSTFYVTARFKLQSETLQKMPWMPYASTTRILVADDTLRGEIICKHTQSANCETFSGKDTLGALLAAQQLGQPYDIVIIDQELKSCDYLDLLKTIQRQKNLKKALFILLVPNASLHEKEQAYTNGFFAAFVKPVQPIAFQTALTSAWEKWLEFQQETTKTENKKSLQARVLMVEDSKMVQYMHKNIFEKLGYEVDIAENGAEGIEMAKKSHHYKLIFVDIGLPDISGYDVIKHIRQQHGRTIPVIALTGYTSEEDKHACIEAGADEVVTKPIVTNTMRDVLSRYH